MEPHAYVAAAHYLTGLLASIYQGETTSYRLTSLLACRPVSMAMQHIHTRSLTCLACKRGNGNQQYISSPAYQFSNM
jgi:hypothetical protein